MQSATLVLILLGITASVGGGSARREPGNDASRERAADLVKQLGDEKFANRERATRELIDIGEPALPSLRKAAAASDPEVRSRGERIMQAISRTVTARELERLQGAWALVRYETDGKRVKGEDKTHLIVFNGEEWTLQIAGQLFQAGTVQRIEVKEKLNAIDLLITQGSSGGVTAVSIYAIQGDSLKYLNCNEPRATEFTTKPGDGRHYLTFRRARQSPKR